MLGWFDLHLKAIGSGGPKKEADDAATWSVIGPLSEWSVAHCSNSIDVPDFTRGAWVNNKSTMDIHITEGGKTLVNAAKIKGAIVE